MGQVCQIGLDIAKEYFHVHGNVLSFFANLPLCLIGLEACGGAHYWAREISK